MNKNYKKKNYLRDPAAYSGACILGGGLKLTRGPKFGLPYMGGLLQGIKIS